MKLKDGNSLRFIWFWAMVHKVERRHMLKQTPKKWVSYQNRVNHRTQVAPPLKGKLHPNWHQPGHYPAGHNLRSVVLLRTIERKRWDRGSDRSWAPCQRLTSPRVLRKCPCAMSIAFTLLLPVTSQNVHFWLKEHYGNSAWNSEQDGCWWADAMQ